jgi:hypothetical protein
VNQAAAPGEFKRGQVLTIRGVCAGKTGWPVDNLGSPWASHFVVLVCFLGRIADPKQMPEIYVVPPQEVFD